MPKSHPNDRAFAIPDSVLLIPTNWQSDPYGQYEDEPVVFVDDVHSWCSEFLHYQPMIYFYDAIEFERGTSEWIVYFKSQADRLLFKLKWSDDLRFTKFREERALHRR